jgi:hypothetical protein
VSFRATRRAVRGGESLPISLTVAETWLDGPDPSGDHRLEAHGCHLGALRWHVQVGEGTGATGAERLDVGERDDRHPRIHRHPHGAENRVRVPAELPPPDACHAVDGILSGALADALPVWDQDEQE